MNVGMKHSNQKDEGQILAGEKGRFIGWMTKFVYMDDSGHLYGSLSSSIWMTRVIRYKEAFSIPFVIVAFSFRLSCLLLILIVLSADCYCCFREFSFHT